MVCLLTLCHEFPVDCPRGGCDGADHGTRRLQEDIGEDDWVNREEQTFWQGAKLAFTDYKTYILVGAHPILDPQLHQPPYLQVPFTPN